MSKSNLSRVAILHYTSPPVVGGVEAVILAHTRALVSAGYGVTIITGRGSARQFPAQTRFVLLPEIDSLHPKVAQQNKLLEAGQIPADFAEFTNQIVQALRSLITSFENVIIHNVMTKHFNLALTAAVHQLMESGNLNHAIAWCHDFTWTSPHSRSKVYSGFPWDILRRYQEGLVYVTVSKERQRTLAQLFGCPPDKIKVIYNGVDPQEILGLSTQGNALVKRLGLLSTDLILLLPVRVTQAKNIEFALQVLAALKNKGCPAKLVITGPPDPHDPQNMAYFKSLLSLRKQLGIEKEVHFVYESGPKADEAYTIDSRIVGDLYRVSDVLFMPSHREGFGMPVLEAGLIGIPIVCTAFPSAVELGGNNVHIIHSSQEAGSIATELIEWVERNPGYRLRRQVRQSYTWDAIVQRDLAPLLIQPA
jgi:glycosyltransferase involved in cell wall biosynthesis